MFRPTSRNFNLNSATSPSRYYTWPCPASGILKLRIQHIEEAHIGLKIVALGHTRKLAGAHSTQFSSLPSESISLVKGWRLLA